MRGEGEREETGLRWSRWRDAQRKLDKDNEWDIKSRHVFVTYSQLSRWAKSVATEARWQWMYAGTVIFTWIQSWHQFSQSFSSKNGFIHCHILCEKQHEDKPDQSFHGGGANFICLSLKTLGHRGTPLFLLFLFSSCSLTPFSFPYLFYVKVYPQEIFLQLAVQNKALGGADNGTYVGDSWERITFFAKIIFCKVKRFCKVLEFLHFKVS